jgi:hypothetical protein
MAAFGVRRQDRHQGDDERRTDEEIEDRQVSANGGEHGDQALFFGFSPSRYRSGGASSSRLAETLRRANSRLPKIQASTSPAAEYWIAWKVSAP